MLLGGGQVVVELLLGGGVVLRLVDEMGWLGLRMVGVRVVVGGESQMGLEGRICGV